MTALAPMEGERDPHKTQPMLVWADIDEGVAGLVAYLNTIPGVRTQAACQGTIGEGGPAPYGPYAMATWPATQTARLMDEFDIELLGDCWGYVRPRDGWTAPDTRALPAVGDGWLPIESAPRDGTPLLLGRFTGELKAAHEGRVRVDHWHERGLHGFEGWGYFNPRFWPATHWQPLPPPPQGEKRS